MIHTTRHQIPVQKILILKKNDDSLKRNLDKETKNADDDEYIENPQLKIDNIKSQTQENLINRILLKRFTIKLIDLIFSNIVRYEMNIISDDFINKTIKTKHKCNQIHLLSMESVLGANFRIPLIHMSKRNIYIEETNERINEFSFAYMFNPTLYTKKVFKEQVK